MKKRHSFLVLWFFFSLFAVFFAFSPPTPDCVRLLKLFLSSFHCCCEGSRKKKSTKMGLSRPVVFLSFLVALPFLWQYANQTFDGYDAVAMVKGQKVLVCGASDGIGEQMAYE